MDQNEARSKGREMQTVETGMLVAGLSFRLRAWHSLPADGWFWTAVAEEHDVVLEGKRAWASARLAHEAAELALVRFAGEPT